MSQRNFRQLLAARQAEEKFLCVGLDPVMSRIRPIWADKPMPVSPSMRETFLQTVVATADFAGAFKPNWGFFQDDDGRREIRSLIEFIKTETPKVPIILDCKVGDIGPSNEGYISGLLDDLDPDAMTVHGYLGGGTWQKALERGDKSLFFLCRTSNLEANEIQEQQVAIPVMTIAALMDVAPNTPEAIKLCHEQGWAVQMLPEPRAWMPLYEYVAFLAERKWNQHGTAALVVGATAPEQLARVRRIAPSLPILIPGVGTQGGKIEDVVPAAGDNFLINASSSILYAFEKRGGGFAQAAHDEAQMLHNQITRCREGVLV